MQAELVNNDRNAIEILEAAIATIKERETEYGAAVDHYPDLTRLQNAFFYQERTPKDVVLANVLEKLDRIKRTDPDSQAFRDSFVDLLGYTAIAWSLS